MSIIFQVIKFQQSSTPEMKSELSSVIRELLEDPQNLYPTYNLTIDQIHKHCVLLLVTYGPPTYMVKL